MQWSVAFIEVERRHIYEECTALISRIKWVYIKGWNCKIVIVSIFYLDVCIQEINWDY